MSGIRYPHKYNALPLSYEIISNSFPQIIHNYKITFANFFQFLFQPIHITTWSTLIQSVNSRYINLILNLRGAINEHLYLY